LIKLPDPRRYGAGLPAHALHEIADTPVLLARVESLLRGGDDAEIQRALQAAPSRAAYVKLWQAVCDAANHTGGAPAGDVVARIFALPLIIITGSRRPVSVPGVVPDIAAIADLFKQHGALGPARNFGLGNALCSLDTIEGIRPGEIYAWTRDPGATRRDLPPDAIKAGTPGEHVHLRFLAGAAIAPASEPSFVETASNIGVWGMPLTRALSAQLAQAQVELLPLARPPLDMLRAGQAGRHAQLETAFNLFASNAVRRLRGGTGDPDAVISTHDDGDIRISLSSPFDPAAIEGFRWPLHPLDDLAGLADAITGLLNECRVTNVQYAPTVLPALNAQGLVWYPRAGGSGSEEPSRH
jgi:hypothetical protein